MIHIPEVDLRHVWADLATQAVVDARTNIAFPGATDLTWPGLEYLFSHVLFNNIGTPYDQGNGRNHTKDLERQVVDMVADMFSAPASRWGYVTSGATEGTEHAMLDARRHHPGVVVYVSAAAHYKIAELCEKLMMPLVVVATDDGGRINIAELERELRRRRRRPAMVIAIAGTTITEAVDDIPAIAALADRLPIVRIHVDAALSGLPLVLEPVSGTPAIDFTVPGVTSIVVSAHKFLSTLEPCAVLVHRQPPTGLDSTVSYTGTSGGTLPGSRSGHTTLRLYASLMLGTDRHRARVRGCRTVAAYAQRQLCTIGVDARRHPHGFTVYFPSPPAQLADKWVPADDGRRAHIVCMPQVTEQQIKEYVDDWAALIGRPTRRLPRQPLRPAAPLTL